MLLASPTSSPASSISSAFDLEVIAHTPGTSISSSPVSLTSPVLRPHTAEPTHSPNVWFDDGNVVLRTYDCSSQSPTIYKAYAGVLSLQSPTLRDRIRSATDECDETYESCSIIDLDESTAEMTPFLEALHDLSNPPPVRLTTVAAIESFIRLSTKYKADRLLRCAISTLEREFPSTLRAYDQRSSNRAFKVEAGQLFRLLNLARESNLSTILPALIYHCTTQFSISQICNGHIISKFDIKGSTTSALMSTIKDPQDIQLCLTVRDKLPLITHRLTSFLRESPPGGNPYHDYGSQSTYDCPDRVRCTLARYRWLVDLPPRFNDPLGFKIDWELYAADLCGECVKYAKESFEGERRRLWDELPGLCSLPGWNVLVSGATSKDPASENTDNSKA